MIEPQPGNAWKVVYGRGWHVSKAMGLAGPDFLAGVQDRADFAKFSRVERLRWLASSLASDERAADRFMPAVAEVAKTFGGLPWKPERKQGIHRSPFPRSRFGLPSARKWCCPTKQTGDAGGDEKPN